MAEEIELRIDGRTYAGWKEATIFRTIEACSGSFSLDVAEAPSSWRITPGMQAQVLLDGEPLAFGWIDSVKRTVDKSGRKMTVEGRDLPSDLVDCSAQSDSGEMRWVTLADVAALLAEPLDVPIEYSSDVDLQDVIRVVAMNPGEGAWEVLERALRLRGLLAFSQPTGALLITRPSAGEPVAAIVEGVNLESGDVTRDDSARYRTYQVVSQREADAENYTNDLASLGSAVDLGGRPPRTLVLQAEQSATSESCELRAQWEASTRAARSLQVGCTVAGWRRPGSTSNVVLGRTGPLWRVNEPVRFSSESLGVDEVLLVASCRYRLTKDAGRTTNLGLMRRDAFQPEPVLPTGPDEDDFDEDRLDALRETDGL